MAEIAVFVAVAQTGSFTRAAEDLGSSKSNVGKAVQRLETRLGTKLFQRTTRAVRLTEDGETYLAAAQDALDGLREAEQQLAARRSEPVGRVKIDLPMGFGRLLLPSFIQLREKYPKLTLEVALNDRMRSVPAVATVGATEPVAVPTPESAGIGTAVGGRGEESAPALGAKLPPSTLAAMTI